jgi:MerR family transcriptional regulator/heat shock protein HspR
MATSDLGKLSISFSAGAQLKDPDQPVYTISIATRLVRPIRTSDGDIRPLHAQTLRTYEREGLVKPKRVGRNRLYSPRDIERLQQIQYLTQERGVNLAGVEIILDLLEKVRELEAKSSGGAV